jgi:hypothetical protein
MRLTPLAWLMIATLIGAVVVWPLSEGASLALGAVFGLLALAAVSDALGGRENLFDLNESSERKRTALRRLAPGRDWHRKAPDYADEPQDAIFERERVRRGLDPTPTPDLPTEREP